MSVLGNITKIASLGTIDIDKPVDEAQAQAQRNAQQTRDQAARNEALNRERFGYAQQLMGPQIGRAETASTQLMRELGLDAGGARYGTQQRAPQYGQYMGGYGGQPRQQAPQQAAPQGGGKLAYLNSIDPEAAQQVYSQYMDQQGEGKLAYLNSIDPGAAQQLMSDIGGTGPSGGYEPGHGKLAYLNKIDPGAASQVLGNYFEQGGEIPRTERQQLMDEAGQRPSYMDIENPFMDEPGYMTEASDAYMQTPAYQAMMDESLRAAEQSATSSGATTYGGRRLKAAGEVGAGVQQNFYNQYMGRQERAYGDRQTAFENMMGREERTHGRQQGAKQSYYNNYMTMLGNMANPSTATNLAGMGVGQGQSIGQQNLAATQMSQGYQMEGVGAQNAVISDMMGGGANVLSGAYAGGYI